MVETAAQVDLDKIVSLCKRRGFIFQSSEIYGGMASTWDYGPLGVELKKNVKDSWWRTFVWSRDDVVGLDAAILMHPDVWRASGHVDSFTDPLVECKACHHRFRKTTSKVPPAPTVEASLPSPASSTSCSRRSSAPSRSRRQRLTCVPRPPRASSSTSTTFTPPPVSASLSASPRLERRSETR